MATGHLDSVSMDPISTEGLGLSNIAQSLSPADSRHIKSLIGLCILPYTQNHGPFKHLYHARTRGSRPILGNRSFDSHRT